MSTLQPIIPSSIAAQEAPPSRSASASSASDDPFGQNGRRGGNGGTAGLRVILVGPTGLDGALRKDPGLELVRTHQPLGAIGELSNPIDADSPTQTTVIVAPDVLPKDRTKAFVQALRRVDPKVRVFALSGKAGDAANFTPEALRKLVYGDAPPPPPAPSPSAAPAPPPAPIPTKTVLRLQDDEPGLPMADEEPRPAPVEASLPMAESTETFVSTPSETIESEIEEPTPSPEPVEAIQSPAAYVEPAPLPMEAPPAMSEPAPAAAVHASVLLDTAPVAALLDDQDPVPAAIDALREAANLPDLAFVRGAAGVEGQPPGLPPQRPHITLIHANAVLGYLTSDGPLTTLSPDQVRWLTTWIALGARHEQLREYAFTDELTGAYNRRYFNRFMTGALPEAVASRQYLTLLFFDIDDFKLYNDRFGHAAGDDILIQVVALLKSVIRPADRVCRIGGDEFVVVFYDPAPSDGPPREHDVDGSGRESRVGAAPQSIAAIAERFQRQICQHRFPRLGELAPGTLTVSGGMATFPWDGRTPEELLARADELAMQSKAQGKNLITLGPGAERICRTI